jgi:hypothetical protein
MWWKLIDLFGGRLIVVFGGHYAPIYWPLHKHRCGPLNAKYLEPKAIKEGYETTFWPLDAYNTLG